MDSWYNDPLVLFNEDPNYLIKNEQGYKIMRDGFQGQMPEMPWKERLHSWKYESITTDDGVWCRVSCEKCQESHSLFFERGETARWPNVSKNGCDLNHRIERWD